MDLFQDHQPPVLHQLQQQVVQQPPPPSPHQPLPQLARPWPRQGQELDPDLLLVEGHPLFLDNLGVGYNSWRWFYNPRFGGFRISHVCLNTFIKWFIGFLSFLRLAKVLIILFYIAFYKVFTINNFFSGQQYNIDSWYLFSICSFF